MSKPTPDGIDSSGFDQFVGLRKKGKKNVASWPTGKEFSSQIKKTGSAATADVTRTNGQFFDPAYFDPLLFWIQHRDRKELNFRLRHAYEYEPIIGNVIDLHRQMPLSGYKLVCQDKSIEREMQDMADKWELLTTSSYILGDYILLGEAMVFKVWDDFNKTWKELTLLPPEKVELRKTYLSKQPLAMLHIDSELKRLANSGDPVDQEIIKNMDPDLVEKIRTSERIYLPSHQFEHFAYKTSEYDLRGTSIVKRALYALLLKYKVRILHNTYLDRGAFPLRIFKLGSESQKWIPSRAHFDGLRNALDALSNDPSGSLIYHFGLNVEVVGTKDKWENLIPHYQWCDSEMLKALFASDAVVDSKGTTFSNSNTALRVLMSRYQMMRDQLEQFWRQKIFRMVAEARGYWVSDSTGSMGNVPTMERGGKFLYLDIPRFKWSKLNLLDDVSQKQFLMRLRERLELPHKTIAEMFDLDPQELKDQLKSEESSIVDPIAIEVRKKASQQPAVQSQVLQGDKSKEWVLDTSTPLDEGKKDKARKDVAGPAVNTPDLGQAKPPGQGQPGMPPPGGAPMMPKPPGGPAGPGMGQPPLGPSPEPGQGPVQGSPL